MRGHLMVFKRGWGAGVPWPLGHARVSRSAIEFWGSLGLVVKRSISREAVVRVITMRGYQRFALFEFEDESLSPVTFQLTRALRRELAEYGWPLGDTTIPWSSRDLGRRIRREND